MRNEPGIHTRGSYEISTSSVFLNLMYISFKKLNSFKDFQSDQIQRSSRKIFTAHYACRNAALNLTPVTGTTNGFIFQMINSLIESWGVLLTYLDCKTTHSRDSWHIEHAGISLWFVSVSLRKWSQTRTQGTNNQLIDLIIYYTG